MSYHKLIWSEDELRKYYDLILPDLNPFEVFFVSLSARNKYLTEEERITYKLGRTEMFERRIIREKSWDRFLRTIKKYEVVKGAYTSVDGSAVLPDKCLLIYININPSNMIKALNEFNKTVSEYYMEVVVSKNDNKSIDKRFNKLDRNLMTAIQKSRGIKKWIDIDIDMSKSYLENFGKSDWKKINKNLQEIVRHNQTGELKYHIIETKSGYHILIDKNTLSFNPNFICERLRSNFSNELEECIINKNAMIPLAGTLQGGFEVKILI